MRLVNRLDLASALAQVQADGENGNLADGPLNSCRMNSNLGQEGPSRQPPEYPT